MMDCIEYKPDMGKINLTNEMIEVLKGLPIEEQAKKFAVVKSVSEEEYSYGQSDGSSHSLNEMDADKCSYARKWIVKDGIIVGIVFSNYAGRDTYEFLDSWCNTYFCSDDDGTGSTEVIINCKLIWKGGK